MDQHKIDAVRVHHEQAAEFDDRYRVLNRDIYDSTFTYGRSKIEALIDRTLADLSPGARVLDAGCGTGFTVGRLRGQGFEVVGVEPADEMRRRAQAANPGATIVEGDIEALPFPDASFDALISIEVVRYLADPSRALTECARVLRPGGVAFITAAPRWSLNGYALVNLVTSRVPVPTFTHVKHSFMSARSARRSMVDAGFASVDVRGAFLGPWHVLQRFLPGVARATMRALEPVDELLADRPVLRDLSNHLVLIGRR